MSLTRRKFIFQDFTQEASVTHLAKTTLAVTTGADNQEDFFHTRRGNYFEFIQTGQNDVKFFLPNATVPFGFKVPLDNTDGDGIELGMGMVDGAQNQMQFVIGTDPAFYIQGVLTVTTLANLDVCALGFRKIGAYTDITTPATLGTAYDDIAALGIHTNAGGVKTSFELNNSGTPVVTVCTQTPVVTAQAVAFRVDVSSAGVCTFKVGLSAITIAAAATNATSIAAAKANLTSDVLANAVVAASRTFDTGDTVVPFLAVVGTGAGAADVVIHELECGVA